MASEKGDSGGTDHNEDHYGIDCGSVFPECPHLRDYARIDLRRTPDGRIYVIEANPNPALGEIEDLAQSAQEAGIDYPELIDRIMGLAIRRSG